MPADLTGARRKLARSKKKLDALSEEVAAYMDPLPFRFVIEGEGDRQAIVCRIDREPDPEWGIDLGEIAFQARSVLDLLIVQLAVDSGNKPGPRTQFPISSNPNQYVKKGRGGKSPRDVMLDGVATRHRRVIDDFQPYHRGRRIHDDPLAILTAVTNRDKHRDLHVTLACVEMPSFGLVQPNGEHQAVKFVGDKFRRYPMADGDELIAITNLPSPNAGDVKVELEVLDMDVTLGFQGDRIVTLADMERAVLHVSGIVDRFASRIKP